jgi:hypothetical protein
LYSASEGPEAAAAAKARGPAARAAAAKDPERLVAGGSGTAEAANAPIALEE